MEARSTTFYSARTVSRTVRRSAPHSAFGLGTGAFGKAGRTRQSRELAGKRVFLDCASSVSSSCEEVFVCAPAQATPPQQPLGVRETQRGLEPSSSGPAHSAPHREGCWDAVERARYRSHSSFVDGRDNYLDVVPRQGRTPSLTERLHGSLSTAACRHKRGSKGIEVRRKPRSSLAPSGARVDEWRNPTDSSAPSRACTIARS